MYHVAKEIAEIGNTPSGNFRNVDYAGGSSTLSPFHYFELALLVSFGLGLE